MLNNVVLIGRLTKDPELKHTQSNIPFLRFTLAVNRTFTQDGERQTDFINCIAWRNQAENLHKYQKKGALIGLEGRIETGSYESEKGTVYTTDVIANRIAFLERQERPQQIKDEINGDDFFEAVTEDDLPF